MRALLVVNPIATATTQRIRDVLVSALAADLILDVVATKGRGHATELAERAVDNEFDLVIALGGDGTVNEVTNGLLRNGPTPVTPALAVVPGGSTNVFARSLGYSASPVEATGELLEALRDGRSRRIGLGNATFTDVAGTTGSRWFTFCAGFGLDAAVVEQVERKRVRGRRNTPGLYLRSALGQFIRNAGRRHPAITVIGDTPDHDPDGDACLTGADLSGQNPAPPSGPDTAPSEHEKVMVAVVCNTTPWTYLNGHAVRACPDASFDTGLDVVGMRKLSVTTTARATMHMLHHPQGPQGRRIVALHDQQQITLTAERELPFQVDGDYIGSQIKIILRSAPRALRVIV